MLVARACANFTATTQTVTDAQVLNTGGTALAYDYLDFFNSTATTVNGVAFSGSLTGAAGVTLAISNFGATDENGFSTATPNLASANLAYIMTGLGYNNAVTGTVTLSNLILGHNYTLQLFAGTGGLGSFQAENVVDGSSTGVLGFDGTPTNNEFITETFTASSKPEVLNITGTGGGFIILNAVNLRDQSVPEPGVTMLLLIGAVGLMVLAHGRHARASRS